MAPIAKTWILAVSCLTVIWFVGVSHYVVRSTSLDLGASLTSLPTGSTEGGRRRGTDGTWLSKESRAKSKRVAPYNATMGFERVEAIVMPHRDDQRDILALLNHVYGLDIGIQPGVYVDDLKVMPTIPEERAHETFKPGEYACWQAHANLWRKMLMEKWSTMLILEGDVDFGVNVRTELANLTSMIPKLVHKLNRRPEPLESDYDDRDPYRSTGWDLLHVGSCVESALRLKNGSVDYPSPTNMTDHRRPPFREVIGNFEYHQPELVQANQKLLKLSVWSSCTVGYAITARGAAKLLHATTREWDAQVDIDIAKMSKTMDLVTFSVIPPLFGQRRYKHNKGVQSDIRQRKRRDEQAVAHAPAVVEHVESAAETAGIQEQTGADHDVGSVDEAARTSEMKGTAKTFVGHSEDKAVQAGEKDSVPAKNKSAEVEPDQVASETAKSIETVNSEVNTETPKKPKEPKQVAEKSVEQAEMVEEEPTKKVMDFDDFAAYSQGFVGEDRVWEAPCNLADGSAVMAMSGYLWPEKTSLGPPKDQEWLAYAPELFP